MKYKISFIYLTASLVCLFLFSLPVFSQRLVFDSSWTPTLNGIVEHFELLSDGKIMIVGDFTTVNGVARKEIARLNADGSLDTSFNADWLGGAFNQGIEITAMKVLSDGKILVAGDMPYDGMSGGARRVRRLNADGSADAALTTAPRTGNGPLFEEVRKVEQLANGKILMCGQFESLNTNSHPHLARFNADGTFDSTFPNTINGPCNDVELLPDGKYIVAGFQTTVNGNASHGLVRFNADDSIDTSFVIPTIPESTGPIRSFYVEMQSDGSMFANLYATGSTSGVEIARLNADGSLRQFFPGDGNELIDVLVQPNGKTFLSLDEDFMRVNLDGTRDLSLRNMNFNGSVSNTPHEPRGLGLTADGKLVVGGTFTSVFISGTGSFPRQYLARFTFEAIPIKPKFDFDNDGRDDIAVFRPSDRVWHLNRSTDGYFSWQFGLSTDIPITADYDGDGKSDIAVWRPDSAAVWYWLRSTDFTMAYAVHGQTGDIPQQRNPDGSAAKLVFRPSDGKWWTFVPFGSPFSQTMGVEQPGDIPVRDDYDGDGEANFAVFRNGNWYYQWGFNGPIIHYQFGLTGDKPVPGDYDGDLRADIAVYRPSDGTWYIKKTTEGFYAVQWGLASDIPVPADYDGDGKTDIGVYRPSDGVWYIMKSTGGYHIEHFGLNGDIPAQAR